LHVYSRMDLWLSTKEPTSWYTFWFSLTTQCPSFIEYVCIFAGLQVKQHIVDIVRLISTLFCKEISFNSDIYLILNLEIIVFLRFHYPI